MDRAESDISHAIRVLKSGEGLEMVNVPGIKGLIVINAIGRTNR